MQTPSTPGPMASATAPSPWVHRLKSLLARRPTVGKAMLMVLVVNEIRGVIVVILVLASWKVRHG